MIVYQKKKKERKKETKMTMTTDQCFDEMAVALGVPKDTGYIDLLAMVKELKEENKKLRASVKEEEDRYEDCNDAWKRHYYAEKEKLKEQNQRMKRYIEEYEVKYCEKCLAYHMDTEEYGHSGVWMMENGCYICDDCYDDLPDEERCEH